jgi:hypothetical protein
MLSHLLSSQKKQTKRIGTGGFRGPVWGTGQSVRMVPDTRTKFTHPSNDVQGLPEHAHTELCLGKNQVLPK